MKPFFKNANAAIVNRKSKIVNRITFATAMQVFTDLDSLPIFQNTVLTIGSFDGVHFGHRQILRRLNDLAKKSGGKSLVVTFDPHPRTILRPDDRDFKLITSTDEKIKLIATENIDCVVVVPFSEEFAKQSAKEYIEDFLLKKFNPRFIVIGYDHRFGNNREGNIFEIKKYEVPGKLEVVEIPKQEVDDLEVSSSKIRHALDSSNLPLAEKLLGHRFSFSGTVVEGQKIGRTIGFPTANLKISDPHKLILPEGIYAAWAILENVFPEKKYPAMLYIGRRPTLETFDNQTIEVNILDFDKNIYGEKLRVEPVEFIRPDEKVADLDQLKTRIETDRTAIRKRLAIENSSRSQPLKKYLETEWLSFDQPLTKSKNEDLKNIAIVILNYNTRQHLAQFLPSVLKNTPDGVRIIVADNGSPDDSVDFLKKNYPRVEVLVLEKNYGFAEGYNRALKNVDAEFYFILNSDVELAENWLEPLLEAMKNDPNLAVVQPKILSHHEKNSFEYAGAAGGWMDILGYPFCRGRIFFHCESDAGQYDSEQEIFWATGAAFFIRAKLYRDFGGFDGDYFAHNEEIDLCWRLKRAGFSIKCIPKSKVFHVGGGTLGYASPRKTYLNIRNSLFSMVKNEPIGKLIWAIPARMLLDWVAGLVFLLKGQWRSTMTIFPAHLDFYKNFRRTLKKRKAAAETIQKIGGGRPENRKGIFPGSIVWKHYINRIKDFSDLKF